MRPKVPDKNVVIEFESNGKVFFSRKLKHIIPSEMLNININLKPQEIGKTITVNINKSEEKSEDKGEAME
jgi:hypothetical protein